MSEPVFNYWAVYDPERIARQNAEIKKWWDELPKDQYGYQWTGNATRPCPYAGP